MRTTLNETAPKGTYIEIILRGILLKKSLKI